MRRSLPLLALILSLSGCGSGFACTTIDAQGVVTAMRPKDQLHAMLGAVVGRTQTAAVALRRDGPSAREAIASEVDAAVERHHREWERNQVAAWATLSPDQLGQVCTALSEGDQATYMKFATPVGRVAQQKNEPLLKRAASEVLSAIF